LFSALRLEKLALFLALGLIVLVAAFGVISTLVLTVMQKVRAIGVLTAMGATPRALMQVFVYQGATMGVVGTLGGAALGVSSAWALDRYQLIKLDPRIYLMDHLPFQIVWSDVVVTIAVALVVSLIATLYPAWRVARLDPVEALRHD
jgi:lipoprotein-releasing system permease protein